MEAFRRVSMLDLRDSSRAAGVRRSYDVATSLSVGRDTVALDGKGG